MNTAKAENTEKSKNINGYAEEQVNKQAYSDEETVLENENVKITKKNDLAIIENKVEKEWFLAVGNQRISDKYDSYERAEKETEQLSNNTLQHLIVALIRIENEQ